MWWSDSKLEDSMGVFGKASSECDSMIRNYCTWIQILKGILRSGFHMGSKRAVRTSVVLLFQQLVWLHWWLLDIFLHVSRDCFQNNLRCVANHEFHQQKWLALKTEKQRLLEIISHAMEPFKLLALISQNTMHMYYVWFQRSGIGRASCIKIPAEYLMLW